MEAKAGTYALVFHCDHPVSVMAGRLGGLQLLPGYYVYVGSAFGPGGVKARIEHHLRISERPHWHLDYLRPHLQAQEIWFTYDKLRREHQWAGELSKRYGARRPFPGFGASDCHCSTHLFVFGYKPSFVSFRRLMRDRAKGHERIYKEAPGDS